MSPLLKRLVKNYEDFHADGPAKNFQDIERVLVLATMLGQPGIMLHISDSYINVVEEVEEAGLYIEEVEMDTELKKELSEDGQLYYIEWVEEVEVFEEEEENESTT